ncbi:MAG TPA: amylo-alpha-1,6-glucosidase [Micromonosporaceae bacterium]|nr:amylo-alpha-1,6-glucosidase [Micromonosporaceae bacterium]
MVPISFGPQVAAGLAEGSTREWLVTDGCGGFAMGTVAGLRTRRYHGLLVVSGDTPASRQVALVTLDPVLILPSGTRVRLGTHEWASGVVDPAGHAHLERFDLVDGLPRWRWRVGDVVLERELAMVYGRPCVGVVDRLVAGGPVGLALEAVCTWRDAHGERYADGPPPRVTPTVDGVVVDGSYRLAGPGWRPTGRWWLRAYQREEAARGLAPLEDLWHAGRFEAQLDGAGAAVGVTAWAGRLDDPPPPAAEIVAAARARNRAVVTAATPADDVDATLALAADAFVVHTATGPDVVAGYPWFGAWSRDTMISYGGLFLATGRADEGRELLRAYAATLSEGMLANTADTGRTEHNTADATLWFLHAVERHVTATGDTDLAAELIDPLLGVVEAHADGTRYGIAVDPADGLLVQGSAGEALTWMDARVHGEPVTQRAGKAVELNALWINGLAGLAALCDRVGRDPTEVRRRHDTARTAFRKRYPAPGGWLHDVVDGPNGDDASMRPNQVLAYSLPYPPIDPDPTVLRVVGAALLTPLGLRTLAPDEPGYLAAHRGGPAERDRAYHQGTVWPWLLGPYADAVRRAHGSHNGLFAGITAHLAEYGLGSVTETANGQPPHAATGCPFQAWSVAEALRVRRS